MRIINSATIVWASLLLFLTSSFANAQQRQEAQWARGGRVAPVTNSTTQRQSIGRASDRAILSLFPESTLKIDPASMGQVILSQQFSPGKSLWKQGLDEQKVFHGEMIHRQDIDNSYTLRTGKGGQVYSLRGPFGESVPPSWREDGAQQSPWNDEVWQFVATCTKYNGFDRAKKAGSLPLLTKLKIKRSKFADSFFVHNSGAYIPDDSKFGSLYCPLLANEMDQSGRCFRMLNWGLVPQIKTIHRSPILFYTQVRDAGDGVIELTWVVHNFSVRQDVVFDHLNAPWGGTRVSSLPFRYVSTSNGDLLERKHVLDKAGIATFRKTGGWNISCAGEGPNSPSLALVYGRDKHLESERAKKSQGKPYAQFAQSIYRSWRAGEGNYSDGWKDWQTRPANSFRNYDVCEVIPKLRIAPGTSIWYRSFLVVGPKKKVIQRSRELVDHVDYGLLEFPADTTPRLFVSLGGGQTSNGHLANRSSRFMLFAKPVAGTKPLFLIQNLRTDQQVVSTDPYIFVPKRKLDLKFPQNHPFADYYSDTIGYSLEQQQSKWKALLGFGYEEKPLTGDWARLSAVLDKSRFPAANKFHLDLWVQVSQN